VCVKDLNQLLQKRIEELLQEDQNEFSRLQVRSEMLLCSKA